MRPGLPKLGPASRFASLPPSIGILGWLGLVCVCSLCGSAVHAQDSDNPLPKMRLPWFDKSQEQVKAMPLDAPKKSGARHRDSQWLYQPSTSAQQLPQAPNINTPRAPSWVSTLFSWMIWITIGIVCLALLLWIAWLLVKQEWRSGDRSSMSEWERDLQLDPARLEELPFDVRNAQNDLLAQARKAHAEGRMKDAVVYLFSYMLLKLDKHHWIRLAKSKTNHHYLFELKQEQQLHSLMEKSVVTFEDVFFGDLPLDPDEFQARWQELDQFHRLVETRPV